MATKNLNTRIQHKTDTAANWELAVNFRPLAGELIIFTYSDKPPRFKIGDGDSYVSGEPRNGHGVLEFTDKDAVTAEDITSGSLIDVIEDPATKSDGQVLTYDGTNEAWIAADANNHTHSQYLTSHQSLSAYRTASAQDDIDAGKAASDHTHDDRYYTESEIDTLLSGKAASDHTHSYISTSDKGVAGGVAQLDTNGKVPSSQLPSYVDDVLEYNNLASLPVSGETGKIYVTLDTNKTYRWGGSEYVEISASLAIGNTSSTAAAGNHTHSEYQETLTFNTTYNASSNKVATMADITSALDTVAAALSGGAW